MTLAEPRSVIDRVGPVPFAILSAMLVLLALGSTLGLVTALAVAVVGLALSATWRIRPWPRDTGVEILPVGIALLILTLTATVTTISEVVAGFAGIATLLWLADVSGHASPRMGRALDQLVMPMAGFAVALGTAYVVPPEPLSLGIATLLLLLVVVLVILVLSRPSIVGRREAPSS